MSNRQIGNYNSNFTGIEVDEAVNKVLNNDCVVKYANLTGSIEDNEELTQALNKVESVKLTVAQVGSNYEIQREGIAQTFSDIYTLVTSKEIYIYISYNNKMYLPSIFTNTSVIFRSIGSDDGLTLQENISINSSNSVELSNTNIAELNINNFSSDSITYSISKPYINNNEARIATDTSVNKVLPIIGNTEASVSNSINIKDSELLEEFYNIGFKLADSDNNQAVFNFSNGINTASFRYSNFGAYGHNNRIYSFNPDFKVSEVIQEQRHFYQDVESPSETIEGARGEAPFYMVPERQYSLGYCKSIHWIGIALQEYHDFANKEERSYTNARGSKQHPNWFIPLTVYGVDITAYDENNEIIKQVSGYTTVLGTEGETCSESNFYSRWYECEDLKDIDDMLNYVSYSSVSVKYNGEVYQGWQCCSLGVFQVDSVEDMNEDREYREVRPPRELSWIVQEVENTNNEKGWVEDYWYNIYNTTSGYSRQPDSLVHIDDIIYNINPTSTEDTVVNDGNFRATFRMFQVPYPDDDYLKAYKAYQLVSKTDPNYLQWTITAGEEDDSFEGDTSNNPNEAQYPYNNNGILWYSVEIMTGDNVGETAYVKADDITVTPVVGNDVEVDVPMYWNRSEEEFFENTTSGSAQYLTDTPESRMKYNGETSFIYDNEERADAEPYFSSDNWGLFKNNHDGTYTKITEAYQWMCSASYYFEPPYFYNTFPSSDDQIAVFDINNAYWWVMQAWECENSETGDIGYTPIPPTSIPVEGGDYSEFAGKDIQKSYFLPMKADGTSFDYEDYENWKYTGNYEANFLERYTALQNGDLG